MTHQRASGFPEKRADLWVRGTCGEVRGTSGEVSETSAEPPDCPKDPAVLKTLRDSELVRRSVFTMDPSLRRIMSAIPRKSCPHKVHCDSKSLCDSKFTMPSEFTTA